jgi:hypothetical protein
MLGGVLTKLIVLTLTLPFFSTLSAIDLQLVSETAEELATITSDQIPPDPDYLAVAALIKQLHMLHLPCGNTCKSSRRDRKNMPSLTSEVVTDQEAEQIALDLVLASKSYDVPLQTVLATAFQESGFRRHALGSSSECGLFQQTTIYYSDRIGYPVVEERETPRSFTLKGTPLKGSEALCAWLLNSNNAAWQYARLYHYLLPRYGDNWPARYNGSSRKWAYQDKHYRLEKKFSAYIKAYKSGSNLEHFKF